MKEAELIAIRRQLHQIPELALQEKETHASLLKTIQSFPQTFLTIRTLPKLPTAILVKVTGSDPQRTIGYRPKKARMAANSLMTWALSPVIGRSMNFMVYMIGRTCLLVRLVRGSERFLPAPLRLTLI